jgi:hypothetical protein
MRGRTALVVGAALVALAVLPLSRESSAATPARADKVLIVSYPRLQWKDVAAAETPVLDGLLARGAVASLSVRTANAVTEAADGYLTMGAGNRAGVAADQAGQADNAPGGGVSVPADEVAAATHAADAALFGAEPGALGDALAGAKRRAGVIANADVGAAPHREAALAVMDRHGRIAAGDVAGALTVAEPGAPGGTRLDPAAVEQAFTTAWSTADVVLVEMSDLERAERAGPPSRSVAGTEARRAAVAMSDGILGRLLTHVDLANDLVIVVAPAAPDDVAELTVFGITGPGVGPGLARSATTRRDGYVTLPDIAPTVLGAFGISVPSSMTGTAVTTSRARAFDAARAGQLADANTMSVFRDRTLTPVSVPFVVMQVLVYIAVVVVFVRGGRPGGLITFALLVILAVPVLTFLSGLLRYDRLGLTGYVVALFSAAVVLAAGVWPLRRYSNLAPAIALVAFTWLVLVVDVVFGGRLQLDTPLGYSPDVAGRFQGFGNLAFALVASCAIVLATVLVRARHSWPAALAVLGVTVIADGWPAFGSDAGGVLACVPAFAVLVMMLRGRRLTWRRVIAAAAAAIAVVSVLALIDLARPASSRTHLGRFVSSIGNGDAFETLHRKAVTNVHVLTGTFFAFLVPILVVGFVIVVTRRRGLVAEVQAREPAVRAALVSSVVLGLLGWALNDSGIAIPAMMIGVVVPCLVLVSVDICGLIVRTSSSSRRVRLVAGASLAGDRAQSDQP